MRVVFAGLSITSSWGNGHATNYRALVAELARRGHEVVFCERDVPWYAAHRDLPSPPGARLCLYEDLGQLRAAASEAVAAADLVLLGSYVPEGPEVGRWLLDTAGGATAFYDIDTPVTLGKLDAGDGEYLTADLVGRFDLYLSFTGGPTLDVLRTRYGARRPLWFPCLVDPDAYRPRDDGPPRYELGYLGTYSPDRQPTVRTLLLDVAVARARGRFVVAGPRYPDEIAWPPNVERIEHLAPPDHPRFYASQRFTLNVTRAQMRTAGWSPSVRLFEAAACGVPIISDPWPGLEEVFAIGEEVLVARSTAQVRDLLEQVDEQRRRELARAARERVLAQHTAARRIDVLQDECLGAEAVGT